MNPINIQLHPHDASEPCPGGCEDIKDLEAEVRKARDEIAELRGQFQGVHDHAMLVDGRLKEVGDRAGRIEDHQTAMAGALATNTTETSEILQILKDAKSFFRFARICGTALKWLIKCTVGSALLLLPLYAALRDWGKH